MAAPGEPQILAFALVGTLWGVVCCLLAGCRTPGPAPAGPSRAVLVIAHRGASGYLPEHTLASYELAIEQGADFIEPDMVMTRDGILVARHENEISGTTDVAEKFPARKKTKSVDGRSVTGWFIEDFSLKEVKTLRARQRLSTRDQSFNGQYEIPTFAEIADLAARRGKARGRPVGLYVETKHPSFFASIGRPLEPALARELKARGLDSREAPVILQSFELGSLKKLKDLVDCRLVFLIEEENRRPYDNVLSGDARSYHDYLKPQELARLGQWIFGIGPHKSLLTTREGVVSQAHGAGLMVHPYTFRSDALFLAAEYNGDPVAEYRRFIQLGVDGLFSDFPGHARRALDEMQH